VVYEDVAGSPTCGPPLRRRSGVAKMVCISLISVCFDRGFITRPFSLDVMFSNLFVVQKIISEGVGRSLALLNVSIISLYYELTGRSP